MLEQIDNRIEKGLHTTDGLNLHEGSERQG